MKVYVVIMTNGLKDSLEEIVFLDKDNAIQYATQVAKECYKEEEIEGDFEEYVYDAAGINIWSYYAFEELAVNVLEFETADGKSNIYPLTIH